MDLEHLYEFAVLAESKNFSEAAEKLFISQSALSKHIKSLEQELGVPLFNRENRSATLN
ncbi:Hca operon transcriptional activator [Streptococcus pasteurianus]|nr:Hca operon transcriptional activator [Streptococcus pasteurianus]